MANKLVNYWLEFSVIEEVGFDDDMACNELMLELIGLECKIP